MKYLLFSVVMPMLLLLQTIFVSTSSSAEQSANCSVFNTSASCNSIYDGGTNPNSDCSWCQLQGVSFDMSSNFGTCIPAAAPCSCAFLKTQSLCVGALNFLVEPNGTIVVPCKWCTQQNLCIEASLPCSCHSLAQANSYFYHPSVGAACEANSRQQSCSWCPVEITTETNAMGQNLVLHAGVGACVEKDDACSCSSLKGESQCGVEKSEASAVQCSVWCSNFKQCTNKYYSSSVMGFSPIRLNCSCGNLADAVACEKAESDGFPCSWCSNQKVCINTTSAICSDCVYLSSSNRTSCEQNNNNNSECIFCDAKNTNFAFGFGLCMNNRSLNYSTATTTTTLFSCDCGWLTHEQCAFQAPAVCSWSPHLETCYNPSSNPPDGSGDIDCYTFSDSKDLCLLGPGRTKNCKWCSEFKACTNARFECSCPVLTNLFGSSTAGVPCGSVPNCTLCQISTGREICMNNISSSSSQPFACTCGIFSKEECVPGLLGSVCGWCENLETCASIPLGDSIPPCTCFQFRTKETCNLRSKKCKFCDELQICVSNNNDERNDPCDNCNNINMINSFPAFACQNSLTTSTKQHKCEWCPSNAWNSQANRANQAFGFCVNNISSSASSSSCDCSLYFDEVSCLNAGFFGNVSSVLEGAPYYGRMCHWCFGKCALLVLPTLNPQTDAASLSNNTHSSCFCESASTFQQLCETTFNENIYGGCRFHPELNTCISNFSATNWTCPSYNAIPDDGNACEQDSRCSQCAGGICYSGNDKFQNCNCEEMSEFSCRLAETNYGNCKWCTWGDNSHIFAPLPLHLVNSSSTKNPSSSSSSPLFPQSKPTGMCVSTSSPSFAVQIGELCNCGGFASQHSCTVFGRPCKWCANTYRCIDSSPGDCSSCPSYSWSVNCPCDIGLCLCTQQLLPQSPCLSRSAVNTTCGFFSSSREECETIPSGCAWQTPILAGVPNAKSYCGLKSARCQNAPMCSVIVDASTCNAAGCRWNPNVAGSDPFNPGFCENPVCFSFFLDGFVIAPFALMFFGFFKDVVVLLLIGVFGDGLLRWARRKLQPIVFWWKKWDPNQIQPNYDQTMYVNDKRKNDNADDVDESFEEYCQRVIDRVFSIPKKIKNNSQQKEADEMRKIFDAVAFALYDNGLWVDLNQEVVVPRRPSALTTPANVEPKNKKYSRIDSGISVKSNQKENKNNDYYGSVEDRNNVSNGNDNDDSENNDEHEQQLLLPLNNNANRETEKEQNAEVNSAWLILNDKVRLSSRLIRGNRVALQKIINDALVRRASSTIFYASSRDYKTRAAASLNSFPSTIQIFYYVSGILLLFGSTFYSVVLNKSNRDIVSAIASYECGQPDRNNKNNNQFSSSFSNNNNNNNATTTTPAPRTSVPGLDKVAFSVGYNTLYYLVGFRLLNASTFATVVLVFVKTIRGIFNSFKDRFSKLKIEQRLPLMSLYSNRPSQILLTFYFLVVSVFALCGPTVGWAGASGIISTGQAVVFPSAIALLILDVMIYNHRPIWKFAKRFFYSFCCCCWFCSSEADVENVKVGDDDDDDKVKEEKMEHETKNSRSKLIQDLDDDDDEIRKNKHNEKECDQDSQASELNADNNDNNSNISVIPPPQEVFSNSNLNSNNNNNDSFVAAAAPRSLAKAFWVFLLTEEFPTIILTISLQALFNYTSLTTYNSSFGASDGTGQDRGTDPMVIDFEARKVECVAELFAHDLSGIISAMSSFLAFF